MIENSGAIIGTFIVYLGLMLAIGVYAYRRTANSSDYFLGGRTLGPWPAALSAGASDMSGWLLLGLPGYAFSSGLESLWLGGGLLLGTWLNWLLVAKRLRTYSFVAEDAITLPEFFAKRFQDKSNLLQVISAFFILLFFLFYTSSGLVAGGKLFETVFGLDYTLALVIGTLCVVSYTLFGGFLAVSWTDLVQGLLMAAALVAVPVIAMQSEGGFDALFAAVEAKNPELLTIWNDASGEPLTWIAIVSLAAWGLGYFGQPHILARFAAIRSNADVPTARRIAVTWSAIAMAGAILVGFTGMIYVDTNLAGTLGDGEKIFMVLVNAMFHPVVAGILLAAILAAIMSTADSQLLVSSSALAEDFYKQVFNKDATQKQVVLVGRVAVIGLSIIALLLALNPDSSVLGLVSYAWAGFGAAFGPTLVLSLYWSAMNRKGALAGVIVGGLTVVVWKQLSGGLFDLYEIVPGIVFATIAIVAVSLATGEPSDEVKAQHKRFKDAL
ncbi:sodium/proline symporter PutP [Neptunomonas phycophila]|uniref:sodium/proline symporter PutP n=1 Tax=Neptunomonas TaxID=75687 RepID=UPI000948CB59|nr:MULTISPECIES: sodium/proline symporter PutP [Neptunomonas]MBT3144567.1 sodium/proline symporter PutP [Neptunomonas phycophila]MDN2660712.1 sodium/proline symporter PutP [Neptunomonas sp. CHC150]MDO6784082.1 sodium/proline symporter PutP [Neptunomonas phycophila]